LCEEISDAAWLVRAIPSRELDPQTGEPTSFSFNSAELSVSCFFAETVTLLLARASYAQLAAVNAGYCRSIGLELLPDPSPDDPHHVLIIMASGRSSRATKLKRHAVRVGVTDDTGGVYDRLSIAISQALIE